MSRFIIHGGRPLTGRISPAGNKNAVLPMIAASVLTDEPMTLTRVPEISDVSAMLELLADLGVEVRRRGHQLTLSAKGLKKRTLDAPLCRKVRSSILLAGPLAARHGEAVVYPPGGDIIGRRRLDTHFAGLRSLGIRIEADRRYRFVRGRLKSAQILLDEASVTATENILMAATLAPGTTVLFNAACEPHVCDLGRMLIKMGARIRGLGTNRIEVDGVSLLHGARHKVGPDHIEVGSFVAAAAVTRGDIHIRDAGPQADLDVLEKSFRKLGVSWKTGPAGLRVRAPGPLRVRPDMGSATAKIEDGIWPAFPSDLMSVALVLATQARGSILFFEKMFESRMYFVDHLLAMGANIVQCDPHRVVVNGPSRLQGAHLTTPDIRAGMALIIAALAAPGESIIENAQIVDRGYERIDRRLRALGADIVRED